MRTYFLSLIGMTTLSFCLGISSAAAAPQTAPVAADQTRGPAQRLLTPGLSAITARLVRLERQSATQAEIWNEIEASQRLVQPRRTSITHLHLLAGPPSTCDGRAATIVGTDGNDVIKGTPGRDVIVGLAGDDQIYGLGQDDLICGGPGDDVIWGGAGNDRSFGGEGNDLIDAGPGNDTSDGGPGDRDGATFWDASAPITASLVIGTATGEGSDTFTNMEELHGGNYNDTLTGNAGPNNLFGLDGNDVLNGGDGNDTLSGGEGNDAIDGGAGQNDLVWFYAATGPIHASLATSTSSGQGNDTFTNVESLSGGNHGDTLIGDSGDNFLWGNGGDDTLSGGAGNDLIDAGPGNDTSDGGPGDRDGATFWDASDPITASLVTGTATGAGSDTFTNMEELHGGNFDDTLTGDAGTNTLFGLDGNDVLNGGAGTDFLNGGEGDDVIDGGLGQMDAVGFYAATGPITASLVTGTSSGQGNDTFTNVEVLLGSDYGDTLTGDAADNWLIGNGGNDTLSGGSGNDYLDGGAGDDTMDGGPGTFDSVNYYNAPGPITASFATQTASGDGADSFSDVEQVTGSNYADTLSGGTGDVWLNGNGGNDTIAGGSGNEFLFGGPGDDTISGGGGDDFLAPGSGTDTLDGGPGFDKAAYWDASGPITASLETNTATGDGMDTYTSIEGIHGGNYDDTLTGSAANEEFFGNGGDDTVHAGGGNDNVNGWDGNDSLYGDAGDDYIDGWNGNDMIDGGDGDDALRGRDGSDSIIGGAGWDKAGYWDAAGPITANLATGTATGEGSDSLSGIEQVDGSPFGDTFIGDAGNNGFNAFGGDDTVMAGGGDDWATGGDGNDSISGNDGNDYLMGGGGDDTIDGGAGWDTSAYLEAPGPVTASLAAGTAVGDGNDALTGIEQLDGSPFGDTFTGDAGNNGFNPFGGDDTVRAGGGDDWANGADGNDSLYGEAGNDYLDGGGGVDLLDGGPDWDTCVNGETTINCEA
jgi:Ca2+-binding RTX toxin-like protein